jgi:glycosyltransferase involved in cell wall biosynthesis
VKRIAFLTTRFEPTHRFVLGDAAVAARHGMVGAFTLLPEPLGGAALAQRDRVPVVAVTARGARGALRWGLGGAARAVKTVLSHRPSRAFRSLFLLPGAMAQAAEMRARGVTHVHACWANDAATLARVCAVLLGGTFSVSAHAYELAIDRATLAARLSGATVVVACSRSAARRVRERIGDVPIMLVRHGVDLERFPFRDDRPSPRPPRVTFLGRLVRKKGVETLIAAAHRLASPVEIVIAGPAPDRRYRRELGRLAVSGPSASRIRFLGPRDAEHELPRASVVVHPGGTDRVTGDEDGVPNVLLEAMALGVPVVAGDAGGVAEIVRDGDTGLLIPPRDPAELAHAIALTLADHEAARARARRARAAIETDHDLAVTGARLFAVLEAS